MTIETSQADITRFLQAARGGTVTFDPAAARGCAEIYQQQADRLRELQQRLDSVAQLSGFGGFFSAQQLQAGFGRKARDAAELLDQYIAAAYRMKEAFLTSAGLYEEADSAHAAALRAISSGLSR
ncbi:hypothetical protein ACFYU5_05510 [Nocardia aobensis]|jgi:hypothetical protein|uniref:Uncharacterized protein n=3 Tax=Nocardia TaxID=1817 RepID=A0A231HDW9_9NOCA|nr:MULTISPECIES: hypothetical protein [Nocardia]NKY45638.1 hypothetical protein [Nocardia cerradoensis]OXR47173.1 hypothetical protein B7C42_00295 [Nocardia cerradoensis]PPJ31506.1 hypothetical protein C5E41_06105 [Nocardia nova]PPJ34578.1 hypothetical protein C5E45_29880 [Nocardia nova]PSR61747.1 hypothetical protein C8258_26145 [Nocardia sp. MDA0666]